MTTKYVCDITGEEFDADDLVDKFMVCHIVSKNMVELNKLDELHVKTSELPDKIVETIEQNENKEMAIDIQLDGSMTPKSEENNLTISYNCNTELGVVDVSLRVLEGSTLDGNPIGSTYSFGSSDPEIREFISKIYDKLTEVCSDGKELEGEEDVPDSPSFH